MTGTSGPVASTTPGRWAVSTRPWSARSASLCSASSIARRPPSWPPGRDGSRRPRRWPARPTNWAVCCLPGCLRRVRRVDVQHPPRAGTARRGPPAVEAIARLGEEGATWLLALALLYAELGMVAEASAQLGSLVVGGLVRVPHHSMRGLVIQAGSFLGPTARRTASSAASPPFAAGAPGRAALRGRSLFGDGGEHAGPGRPAPSWPTAGSWSPAANITTERPRCFGSRPTRAAVSGWFP